jgi:hypothetical protein
MRYTLEIVGENTAPANDLESACFRVWRLEDEAVSAQDPAELPFGSIRARARKQLVIRWCLAA